MTVFNSVVAGTAGDAVLTAVATILRRAETMNLRNAPWSLAELRADEADYEWLRTWGQALDRQAVNFWLGCPWLAFSAEGQRFTRPAGIGLLLLFLFSELARREASEGILWPIVRRFPFRDEVASALFVNGQPTQALKDALEAASRMFGLRHVFGIDGLQNWFDTVYLQFGFTERGFHRRLAEWLAGQGLTRAVKHLSDPQTGSPTFVALWQSFKSFRQRNLSEQRLRQVIRGSPWVLPAWENDLILEASRQIEYVVSEPGEPPEPTFLSDPVLRWTPPGGPGFVCRISGLADFDLTEPAYHITVCGQNQSHLLRQADGLYQAVPEEIVLPSTRPSLLAALTTDQGQVIKTVALKLWDEADDVTVFRLPNGQRLPDAWETPLNPAHSYAVLAASDLVLAPQKLNWTCLANGDWKLHLLGPGWPSEARLLLGDDILWKPTGGPGMAAIEPPWSQKVRVAALAADGQPRLSVHVTESCPLRICHPDGVTVLRGRIRRDAIEAHQATPTATLTAPVRFSWEHLGKPLSVQLTLRRGDTTLRVRRPLLAAVAGCARLDADGWHLVESSSSLTLEQARADLFVVGTKFGFDANLETVHSRDWALVEGEIWHGLPPRLPRCLGTLCGLGASLTLWKGPYNNTEEPFVLSSAVVDTGIVQGAVQIGDKIRLRLNSRISPDSGHQVIFWNADGSVHQVPPNGAFQEQDGHVWEVVHPKAAAPWMVAAVGYNGTRLGAHWKLDWPAQLEADEANRVASLLRWFRLPLLSQTCLPHVRQFAHAHVADVLPVWLKETCGICSLTWAPPDDGWLAAVRSVFFDWHPTDPYEVESLVDGLTGQTADADTEQLLGPAVFQLSRVDPVLMGKVVECWMRHISPEWHGAHGRSELLKCLSGLLLAGRTPDAARTEVAATMNCDENFVEVELVGQSLQRLRVVRIPINSDTRSENIRTAIRDYPDSCRSVATLCSPSKRVSELSQVFAARQRHFFSERSDGFFPMGCGSVLARSEPPRPSPNGVAPLQAGELATLSCGLQRSAWVPFGGGRGGGRTARDLP